MTHDCMTGHPPRPCSPATKALTARATRYASVRKPRSSIDVRLPAEDASHRLGFTEGYAPYSQRPGAVYRHKGAGGLLNGAARTV